MCLHSRRLSFILGNIMSFTKSLMKFDILSRRLEDDNLTTSQRIAFATQRQYYLSILVNAGIIDNS